MLTNTRVSDLVSQIVEYSVRNMNEAVSILDQQRCEIGSVDDLYQAMSEYSSADMDDFVVDMATSDIYIDDTIEKLKSKGYKVCCCDEEEDDEVVEETKTQSDYEFLDNLIFKVGKKEVMSMLMDL